MSQGRNTDDITSGCVEDIFGMFIQSSKNIYKLTF